MKEISDREREIGRLGAQVEMLTDITRDCENVFKLGIMGDIIHMGILVETMPNETLIDQLGILRDSYTQQRKTSAALLAVFKATVDTHHKVNRILNEYSQQNSGLETSALAKTQETFTGLQLKEKTIDPLLPDLRREVKTLSALVTALGDAAAALRSNPVDVVRLDRALNGLQGAQQENIQALLPELGEELNLAQRALGDEFGQALRGALAEQGLSIGGRVPRFEIGRFELDANFAKRFAVIRYGKDIVIPRVSLTVDAVLKAYQTASKTVAGRSEDGAKWLAQCYEAYQNARRKREITGTRVNIIDCYIEMVILRQGRAFITEPSKRTFNDYSRAQFAYDFYEFANRQRLAHQGYYLRAHSATKSQADSPAKSLWIVEGDSPYDGRYIADIEFEKE